LGSKKTPGGGGPRGLLEADAKDDVDEAAVKGPAGGPAAAVNDDVIFLAVA